MGGPLDHLFHARSVALVGLSGNPAKMTGAPLAILRQTGFQGEIFPVNPGRTEIDGLRSYADIAALPEAPDAAMIMLPAADCVQAVKDCAAKGIRACVIPSSGFEETGDGHLASELRDAAREAGMVIVGPNCEGVWSVRSRVLLTFGSAARRNELHHAPIAILSQSGAMAGAMARHLQNDAVGCAYVVSVGNETVLTIADYLEWMIEQDDVRVVALFIEGLRDGQRLLHLIAKARSRGIRVVALKCGNTATGAKAAATHTGKIASSYAIYRDLLGQAGAIMVDSLTDLIQAAEVLATALLPRCRGLRGGVSVFSIPGGTRAMTADHLDGRGVPLAIFSRDTVQALERALPEFGGVENPTDLTGQVLSHPGLFDEALHLIANDAQTEALIVQVANRGPEDVMARAALLASVAEDTGVPIIASFLGDSLPAPHRRILREKRILCARDPAEAARQLHWLYLARDTRAQEDAVTAGTAELPLPHTWEATAQWLEQAGITLPAWRIVQGDLPIASICEGLNFPVAVKALPEDADHKTELGLVALNVGNIDEVAAQVMHMRRILDRPRAGILVQEMVPSGVETVLAATHNPDFGPILAIGLGGVAIEVYRDLAWLPLPTTRHAVLQALSRLRMFEVLEGFRGRPRADVDALAQAAVDFGNAFLATRPAAGEMEINPLMVLAEGSGVAAVDALIKA